MIHKNKTAFCFDLDGTVSKTEFLPLLAKELKIEQEMAVLTYAALNGIIPYVSAFHLRVRLLKDIPITVSQNIIINAPLHTLITDFISSKIQDCFIITTNLDVWVAKLLQNIGCEYYTSEANYEGNTLLGVNKVLNKGEAIKDIRNKGFENIVAIGDGINDVSMFEQADIKIAFGGVHPPVSSLIKLANYLVYNEKSLCNILAML